MAAAQSPEKKSHTLRNVILVILALVVLTFAGCIALYNTAVDEINTAIDKDDNEVGGRKNPLTIKEGEAFKIRGFEYDSGWKIVDDGVGDTGIKGLKVTNSRDDTDSAIVEIKLMKANEVVALVDCDTDPVAVGQKDTLDCVSDDKLPRPKQYDRITINDTF